MEKGSVFFMVFLEGERTPVFKHSDMISAEKEAKRLALTYDKKAYVLCTIKSFAPQHYIVEDCRPDDDLPF